MRVVIIGVGIGGLAASVALRRIGFETIVIERNASIREVGAGLSLWSNAVNALCELGLEARVMASASVIARNPVRTPAGHLISQNEFGGVSRMAGAPCVSIHRAVLQKILLGSLPPASVRTGARCSSFDNSTATLENGERIQADVLVGADGISSVILDGLHGAEPPRHAGTAAGAGFVATTVCCPMGRRCSPLAWVRNSGFGLVAWDSSIGSSPRTASENAASASRRGSAVT